MPREKVSPLKKRKSLLTKSTTDLLPAANSLHRLKNLEVFINLLRAYLPEIIKNITPSSKRSPTLFELISISKYREEFQKIEYRDIKAHIATLARHNPPEPLKQLCTKLDALLKSPSSDLLEEITGLYDAIKKVKANTETLENKSMEQVDENSSDSEAEKPTEIEQQSVPSMDVTSLTDESDSSKEYSNSENTLDSSSDETVIEVDKAAEIDQSLENDISSATPAATDLSTTSHNKESVTAASDTAEEEENNSNEEIDSTDPSTRTVLAEPDFEPIVDSESTSPSTFERLAPLINEITNIIQQLETEAKDVFSIGMQNKASKITAALEKAKQWGERNSDSLAVLSNRELYNQFLESGDAKLAEALNIHRLPFTGPHCCSFFSDSKASSYKKILKFIKEQTKENSPSLQT